VHSLVRLACAVVWSGLVVHPALTHHLQYQAMLPLRQLLVLFTVSLPSHGFNIVFMGARRGKKSLEKSLKDEPNVSRLGQEITGVTLPTEGAIKGWEFGQDKRIACANVGNDQFYALQADCPRCGFDLYKGDLITDRVAFEDCPRIACPTCSTTYGLRSGEPGPPLKRTGLAGWVGNLAKTATADSSYKKATVFTVTRNDEDGRVFLKEGR